MSLEDALDHFVASWLYISDGDVRLSWTRRYCRYDPTRRCIYASAREGAMGKPLLFLAQGRPGEVHHISHLEHHSHIVSPFAFPPTAQRFYLLDVSDERFGEWNAASPLPAPEPRMAGNGISLLLKDVANGALANVVLCAENHIRANMWISALKHALASSDVI